MGRYLVQESLRRLDEREFMWEYIQRQIYVGRDDTEAIALIVCPACMLVLLNRQCSKEKKGGTQIKLDTTELTMVVSIVQNSVEFMSLKKGGCYIPTVSPREPSNNCQELRDFTNDTTDT